LRNNRPTVHFQGRRASPGALFLASFQDITGQRCLEDFQKNAAGRECLKIYFKGGETFMARRQKVINKGDLRV
jgi:hypothetical protein